MDYNKPMRAPSMRWNSENPSMVQSPSPPPYLGPSYSAQPQGYEFPQQYGSRFDQRPYRQPFQQPYSQPFQQPNQQPNQQPYSQPFQQPNQQPYSQPFQQPNQQPYSQPFQQPNQQPNQQPYSQPFQQPNQQPYSQPFQQPFQQPNQQPNSMGQERPVEPGIFTVQPAVQNQQEGHNVNNYLCYSIFTMLLCCLPLGIVALVNSILVRDSIGSREEARRHSRRALILNNMAVVFGIVIYVTAITVLLIVWI
ncbi:alpha/beta-gliadin A-V-like isoform X2 [Girardinichthys multiradiatus]|nr:alpha/beta-gliadin A-V-like isoform X2 [Girardinichthys multiradiatus]